MSTSSTRWFACSKCQVVSSYDDPDGTSKYNKPEGFYGIHTEFIATNFATETEARQWLFKDYYKETEPDWMSAAPFTSEPADLGSLATYLDWRSED